MGNFGWIGQVRKLSPPALIVIAQMVDPRDNGDGGRLRYGDFFNDRPIDSVRLAEVMEFDFRPVADRRAWGANGRLITMKTPDIREVEIDPIEARHVIGERELQHLLERAMGNDAVVQDLIAAGILGSSTMSPIMTGQGRAQILAGACWRRIELDAFYAWSNQTITIRNPDTGDTVTLQLSYDSARLPVEPTAWDNNAVNAYDRLVTRFRDEACTLIGGCEGAVLRQAALNEIRKDAPTGPNGYVYTTAEIAQRISDELGTPFRFYVLEEHLDVYSGAGQTTAAQKIWPKSRVAAIPPGMKVGNLYRAPVGRAYEVARIAPDAKIDVRGVSVYLDEENSGKELSIQAQLNSLALVSKTKMYCLNIGLSDS